MSSGTQVWLGMLGLILLVGLVMTFFAPMFRPIGCVIAESEVPVLREPHPLDYPSTKPFPNATLWSLPSGDCVEVRSRGYGKDFMYFRVRSASGEAGGYVVSDAGAKYEEGSCPSSCRNVR